MKKDDIKKSVRICEKPPLQQTTRNIEPINPIKPHMKLAAQYATINAFDRLSQPLQSLNILRTPNFNSQEKGRSRIASVSPSNKENNAKSFKSLLNS